MTLFRFVIFLCFGLVIFVSTSYAYDITDKFSIGGVLSGAYQYQLVDGEDKYDVPGMDDLEGLIGGIRMTAKFDNPVKSQNSQISTS
jgi:long-subunit fatty acid transport protein